MALVLLLLMRADIRVNGDDLLFKATADSSELGYHYFCIEPQIYRSKEVL